MLERNLNTIDLKSLFDLDDKFDLTSIEKLDKGVLTAICSTDLEIEKIHLIIKNLFVYNIQQTPEIKKKISIIDEKIKESISFTLNEKLKKEKRILLNKLDIFTEEGWNEYVKKSADILKTYLDMSSNIKKNVIILGKNKQEEQKDVKIRERLELIRKYLKIIDKYIEVDIVFNSPYEIGCIDCEQIIDSMYIDDEHGVYICGCNAEFGRIFNLEATCIDPEKIDLSSKNTYDDKINFIRRLKVYQGIEIKKISDKLIDTLDKHMQDKYKHPPAEEIRKMDPDKYGRRGTEFTSVQLLITALKETDNQSYFQDFNPICYKLWGWICPSIDHIYNKIIEDYVRTQEIYKAINSTNSSINVELRLYWHLRIAGHDCCLDDFKIPMSIESKKRNSDIFQKMCKKTGLEFYPII